ncbi:hypothetical protein GGS24DRAFT_472963 [Hypoxylon argillaceum]|nr:hypothetical protein GGS24DRAFT_472963 [Hypoxylon argillaceum]
MYLTQRVVHSTILCLAIKSALWLGSLPKAVLTNCHTAITCRHSWLPFSSYGSQVSLSPETPSRPWQFASRFHWNVLTGCRGSINVASPAGLGGPDVGSETTINGHHARPNQTTKQPNTYHSMTRYIPPIVLYYVGMYV